MFYRFGDEAQNSPNKKGGHYKHPGMRRAQGADGLPRQRFLCHAVVVKRVAQIVA
jgi:hypothetical protein